MRRSADPRSPGVPIALAVLGLLGLVVACQAGQPSPTATPTADPASPRIPLHTSPTPFSTEPASPSPTAIDDGRPTDEASGWQYLSGFPPGDALEVTSVTPWRDGFLAVGYEPVPGEGFGGRRNGVLWHSSDGLNWERRLPPEFASSTMLYVVDLGAQLFAFGSVCPEVSDNLECEDAPGAGIAAWRSADAASWQPLALPDSLGDAILDGVTTGPGGLLVYGGTGDESAARIWTSGDGERWQEVGDLDAVDPISALAAGPEQVVAFGVRYLAELDEVELLAAYFADNRFLPAQLPPGQRGSVLSVSWGAAGFVAVGLEEPLAGEGLAAVALTSADGVSWTAPPDDALPAENAFRRVVGLPSGYLAIGSVPEVGEFGRERPVAFFSPDGLHWEEQGQLEGGLFRQLTDAALGGPGVIVFATDFDETDDEEPLGDGARAIHAWFMTASDLP